MNEKKILQPITLRIHGTSQKDWNDFIVEICEKLEIDSYNVEEVEIKILETTLVFEQDD